MSYKLDKPYTQEQYADFVVEHNHFNGRTIEETQNFVYALEKNEILIDSIPAINPNYEEQKLQKEKERISKLFLTRADVERAIYQVKGMDFEDIAQKIETLKQVQGDSLDIDIKALKIELKANNFYRGNPYISQIGALLGFSESQLDNFFETGDYTKLLDEE